VIATKTTTVSDVMTTSVVFVREDADFKEMVTLLRSRRVSAFPVLDAADRVIGVVSEADLLAKEAAPELPRGLIRLAWRLTEGSKAAGMTAAEVMTKPAITIGQDAPVAEAAQLMQSHRIKRLPVIDDSGRLCGIVSRADVLSVFERPDSEIQGEVVKGVITGEFGLDPELFVVTVRSGVVTITGRWTGAPTPSACCAIRHLEGVVAVRERLSYPDQD